METMFELSKELSRQLGEQLGAKSASCSRCNRECRLDFVPCVESVAMVEPCCTMTSLSTKMLTLGLFSSLASCLSASCAYDGFFFPEGLRADVCSVQLATSVSMVRPSMLLGRLHVATCALLRLAWPESVELRRLREPCTPLTLRKESANWGSLKACRLEELFLELFPRSSDCLDECLRLVEGCLLVFFLEISTVYMRRIEWPLTQD